MVRTMLGFSSMVEGASPAASRSGKPRGELGGELVRLVSIDTTRKRPKFDEAGLQPCDPNILDRTARPISFMTSDESPHFTPPVGFNASCSVVLIGKKAYENVRY